MNILAITTRSATLALILTTTSASNLAAQAHKGQNHGTSAKANATPATPAAKPAPDPQVAPTPAQNGATSTVKARPLGLSDEELLASLHAAMTRLNQANLEYRGHRVRAIREVDKAIKLVAAQAGPMAVANAVEARAIPVEPATTSRVKPPNKADIPLSEAQALLQGVESRMSGDGINSHQYMQAINSIRAAIRELNLALVEH